ncbi:LLM class F420-dependent oxidoreductase [Mycobacterium avium]|uniref:LLM class F420-dependent oxidoreductase n=1 Tax=Mycobacterium avium TaxID=1764 RepID=UPI000213AFCC|nr:LLM class F420-dependent oxidoreductase [Mycobacterium avium]AZP83272.1 LLM class F420-dependent oxidoreductase [Mycobacterium avium subsp. paratuberculosis]ETB15264.1 N5,N10-methylene tetrahydromethanopterin reductase [Mycobacterium avium subsp. paratuberculosis 08-8281]QPM73249.1 LLM class F420-dependent oxidoreductase [Mycobacterium avium subsp. paratuberculosis S397]WPS76278.1 LLM class F420-dependent oxidoreductase [Mycobacterium avium subsp. paratuberculosis]
MIPSVGVQIQPAGTPNYRTWRAAVIQAECMGADLIFGYDHFHEPVFDKATDAGPVLSPHQPEVNHFEGWSALASWGEIINRAQIGLLVTGVGYRNPDLLADMARTVDHISNGRLILGLGAGRYEKDYATYGYEFGTVASRMSLFDASLARIKYRLAQLKPPPLHPIPILIGSSGEKKTLPRVARHADIWHTFLPIEQFRIKSQLLDDLAQHNGRDGTAITRAVPWFDDKSADEYVAAGARVLIVQMRPTEQGYDFSQLIKLLTWPRQAVLRTKLTQPISRKAKADV